MHRLSPAYCDHLTYAVPRASILLKRYGNFLTWSDKKEVIADVGCANGVITTDILLPFCADKVDQVIGIDISSDMLEVANKLNKNPKATFLEMDVAMKDIDCDMVGKFDHIFSFCSVHMIPDQKQLAENLFKMLKPKGELFITFLTTHSLTEGWFHISGHDKWSKYLTEFRNQFAAMIATDNPKEDFERVFTEAGFAVQTFEIEGQKYATDRKTLEDTVINVNIPLSYIPENLRNDFLKDHLELMTKLTKNGDSFETSYKEIVAIARKH